MKKTFAIFALAGAFAASAAADADTEWTFSSSATGTSRQNFAGAAFTLGSNTDNRYSVTPSDIALPDQVILESVSFTLSDMASLSGTVFTVTGERVLYITDSSNRLLAVSESVTLGGVSSTALFTFDSTAAVGDATLTNTLVLNTADTYYAYFAEPDTIAGLSIGDTVGSNKFDTVGLSMERDSYTTAGNSEWGLLSGQKTFSSLGNASPYAPMMTIKASSVPEPATATLSLLALAGLAARRRRK